jgi:DNA-binding transcriptional ArsR family regulator
MDTTQIALTLAELGNTTRLDIFRMLVRAGHDGLVIGAIQRRLAIPASTLGFHLRGLVAAGLVSQEKQGRSVVCRAELAVLTGVLRQLETECCSESEDARKPARNVA